MSNSGHTSMETDEIDRDGPKGGNEEDISTDELSQRSSLENDAVGSPNNSANDTDDVLRRMMADLRDGSPPKETTSQADSIVQGEKVSLDSVRTPVMIDTAITEDAPGAQSSPSYAAAEWAAKLGGGVKTTPTSSSSAASSSKSWRDDFVAAVQANKRKRKMAAEKVVVKPKKKRGRGRPSRKATSHGDNFDTSSVSSAAAKQGRRRAPEFTDEEKEAYVKPFNYGWKREMVYRKIQKKGSEADVYYIAPNGIRLRSMPEVDDYLRTANEKVTREHFSFRRIVIGFTEIPGAEIVRGALSPDLVKLDQTSKSTTPVSAVSIEKPSPMASERTSSNVKPTVMKKAVSLSSKVDKNLTHSATKSDDEEDCSYDDSSSTHTDPGSRQSGKPRALNLMNLFKNSLSSKEKLASPSSSSSTMTPKSTSPKKKPIQSATASSSVMQRLRKVAISESHRQRNALLKSIAAVNIPTIDAAQDITASTPPSIKNKARKSICTSQQHGDGSSRASSTRDGSETSSEQDFRIVTCSNDCPVRDTKWTPITCITCLRLFHKDCLAAKGRVLPTLEFECTECAPFPNRDRDGEDDMYAPEELVPVGKSSTTSGRTDILIETTSRGGSERPLFSFSSQTTNSVISVSNNVPADILPASASACTLSSVSLSTVAAPAMDDEKPDLRSTSPRLDMAIDASDQVAQTVEVIVNGDQQAVAVVDIDQASPVVFPFERVNGYTRALESIFKRLSVLDLMNVRRVCKAWNIVSYSPTIWKFARLQGCRLADSEHAWPMMIDFLRKRGVEELDLAGCRGISMGQFIDFALPTLSQFVVGYHYGQVLPNLMESTASMCGTNLRSITMTLIKDKSLSTDWISSNSFACLASCTELIELRISATDRTGKRQRVYINGDGLSALASLTKLRVLALFDVRAVDETVFKFLDSLTALRVLEIGDCQCWTRETYSRLRRLLNLRRLRLECFEPGAAGDVLAESLSTLKDLREAELIKYAFDYSYVSALASQPLLALSALPNLHTLLLYPDLEGKFPAPTWRRTLDVLPHFASLKRLELGITTEESADPPADVDMAATSKPPFMSSHAKQPQKIAYINKDALGKWIGVKLPNTVSNVVDWSSSELSETRVAKLW